MFFRAESAGNVKPDRLIGDKKWQSPYALRFEIFPREKNPKQSQVLFYGNKDATETALGVYFQENSTKLRVQTATEDNKYAHNRKK